MGSGKQWERQNTRFSKRPAYPAISSHRPTPVAGGVPRYGAVKWYSAGSPAGSPCACGKTLSLTDEVCWMRKLLLPPSPRLSRLQNMSDLRDPCTIVTIQAPYTWLRESLISPCSGRLFSGRMYYKRARAQPESHENSPEFIAQHTLVFQRRNRFTVCTLNKKHQKPYLIPCSAPAVPLEEDDYTCEPLECGVCNGVSCMYSD
jgi:hypothetical protein